MQKRSPGVLLAIVGLVFLSCRSDEVTRTELQVSRDVLPTYSNNPGECHIGGDDMGVEAVWDDDMCDDPQLEFDGRVFYATILSDSGPHALPPHALADTNIQYRFFRDVRVYYILENGREGGIMTERADSAVLHPFLEEVQFVGSIGWCPDTIQADAQCAEWAYSMDGYSSIGGWWHDEPRLCVKNRGKSTDSCNWPVVSFAPLVTFQLASLDTIAHSGSSGWRWSFERVSVTLPQEVGFANTTQFFIELPAFNFSGDSNVSSQRLAIRSWDNMTGGPNCVGWCYYGPVAALRVVDYRGISYRYKWVILPDTIYSSGSNPAPYWSLMIPSN